MSRPGIVRGGPCAELEPPVARRPSLRVAVTLRAPSESAGQTRPAPLT